jgi:hypothetical protein
MTADPDQWTRRLGAVVGGAFLLLGIAELVGHLDEPQSLFFWLPALWGGGVLVLVGVFRTGGRPQLGVALVILGGLLGALATAWTLVMPILIIALIVLTIVRTSAQKLAEEAG